MIHIKINVEETCNPTPDRSQDYCAVYDGYDGAPDAGHHCMGMGATKEKAIAELKECGCGEYEESQICYTCRGSGQGLSGENSICINCKGAGIELINNAG